MDFNLTEEQIAFQNSVRSLADKYLKEGSTIIMVSHDELLLKNLNHHELIMERGRILNV